MQRHTQVPPRDRFRAQRRGLSALEVVLATAIMMPPLGFLFYNGIYVLNVLYSAIGAMVGSPYM